MTDIHAWHPLTEAQAGIWYAQARDPQSPVFVTGQALHIRGPLDVEALARAVDRLGQEAECLSMRVRSGAQEPEHRIEPDGAPALRVVTCSGDPSVEIRAEAQTPMDLEHGPVAGFTLWRLGPEHHILSERIHHIAADGQAMVQITQRLAAIYAAELGSEPQEPLAPYARALDEDARFRGAPARTRQRDHWHKALAGLPEVESMATGQGKGDGRWFHRSETGLPQSVGSALLRLADAADIHWTDALTALTGAYVGRHLPQVSAGEASHVVLGIPLQNRMGKIARCPCTQVNVLPLHLQLDEDVPLTEWVRRAGVRLAELRRHSRYRGEALAREMGRIGAGRRLWGPLVNILPFEACPDFPGCDTRLQIIGAGSVDDITFCFRGDPRNGLIAQVDSNTALYSDPETVAHGNRLVRFLDTALNASNLHSVPTLTPEETDTHVRRRNDTLETIPQTTLWALIEAQMKATPEPPALVYGDRQLSYAELDQLTADLAGRLAARRIGPGRIVGIGLRRSVDLIVALLATLRAGAAYVPFDPDDRSTRRTDMIERAAPTLILADAGFDAGAVPVMQVTDAAPSAVPQPPRPEDPAYVLFTSGSTGRPKGVVIDHAAIVNRLLWMRETYAFGPGDRILQKTPATFDVSVWEFFLPFLSGATLVVAPPEAHRDPAALARLVREHDVTAMHFVPSMLELFLDAPASRGLRIKQVFASGEALPARLAEQFHRRIKGRLHNLYGPTEAAVDVTFHEAKPGVESASVPIGRPVWNTRTYLLDAAGRPVPDGVPGRLYIAGCQLARGYLAQPELTAERFLPDRFHIGERMYDTGDLAVSDGSGVLTFVGRADTQVKIRGVRIELAEIERALAETGLVRQAVVQVLNTDAGTQLAAWVVPAQRGDVAAIRNALARRLPQAMLPAHIVLLDVLPLTPSGKLDRKALPFPDAAGQGPFAAPESNTERLLAKLFAETLGLTGPVSADTDFFLAGGDSLRAVRLCLRLQEDLGYDPGLGTILETPVLADLARRLEGPAGSDHGLGPLIRLSQGKAEAVPLFAVHPAGGLAWCYRTLARALPDIPVTGVQSPLLDPRQALPPSLSELAAAYMNHIDRIRPDGPIILLGWSLGGIIAHAMAAEAERRKRRIDRLVLLDAYPSQCWRNEPEPDEATALRALLAIAGFDPDAHQHLDTRPAIMAFLAAKSHPLALLPHAVQDGVIRSVRETNGLVRGHREPRLSIPLLHVTAAQDQAGTGRSAALWAPFAGGVESLVLDCRHADLIGVGMVREIAARLLRGSVDCT